MCGITGWVSFHSDARTHATVIEAMTATLAPRGPDASGVWLGEHAAIGHRRLAVIDPEGGGQPMTDRARRADRRARLQRRDLQPPRTPRRTEGPGARVPYPQRHRGGAARLRPVGRRAGRPAGGHVRLRRLGRAARSGCCWSATASASSRSSGPPSTAPAPSSPNPRPCSPTRRSGLAWARTGSGRPTACCSPPDPPWCGVREVEPGGLLVLDRAGRRERRYWQLTAVPLHRDREATVARVRDIVTAAAHGQLEADVPLCSLLSGGIDSTVPDRPARRRTPPPRRPPTPASARTPSTTATRPSGSPGTCCAPATTPRTPSRPAPTSAPTTTRSSSTRTPCSTPSTAGPSSRPGLADRRGRHGHLAVPALRRDTTALHRRPVRRGGRRGVRRLPLVPPPRGPRRRHLPLAAGHRRRGRHAAQPRTGPAHRRVPGTTPTAARWPPYPTWTTRPRPNTGCASCSTCPSPAGCGNSCTARTG